MPVELCNEAIWRIALLLECCTKSFQHIARRAGVRELRLWHAAYGNFAVMSPRSDADALMCWRCLSDVAAFELTNITKKARRGMAYEFGSLNGAGLQLAFHTILAWYHPGEHKAYNTYTTMRGYLSHTSINVV